MDQARLQEALYSTGLPLGLTCSWAGATSTVCTSTRNPNQAASKTVVEGTDKRERMLSPITLEHTLGNSAPLHANVRVDGEGHRIKALPSHVLSCVYWNSTARLIKKAPVHSESDFSYIITRVQCWLSLNCKSRFLFLSGHCTALHLPCGLHD